MTEQCLYCHYSHWHRCFGGFGSNSVHVAVFFRPQDALRFRGQIYKNRKLLPDLGPMQPAIWWVLAVLSPGVKWPWHEADHSPPSSTKVKNLWSYTSTHPICLDGVVLT